MRSGKLSLASVFTSSLCCVAPVLLAATGMGGLGLSAFIGAYHWYFIAGSALVLAFSWWSFVKEGRCCSSETCKTPGRRVARISLPVATLVVVGFAGMNLYAGKGPTAQTALAKQSGMARTAIAVEGMSCAACTIAVEGSLTGMEGVQQASASVSGKSVTVVYDPGRVRLQQLIEAINQTGYQARL